MSDLEELDEFDETHYNKETEKCDLLCCPFCGATAKMTSTTFGDSMKEYYRVECENGDALDCWDDTENEARQTWNRRRY
ncbi:hypothetical protein [Acinetobacter sp.]|uniref:hypothetical protein n=1 Tax=Acinetobacter sp. TaxID=472 RepID=UPI003D07669A